MINYAKLQAVLQEKINQLNASAQPVDGVQLLTLSRAAEKLKDNSLLVVADVTARNALTGVQPGMLVWVESLNQLQFFGTNSTWAPVFNGTTATAAGKAATQVSSLRQTVIGQTQTQINALDAETAQDNHTLLLALSIDNLTSDRMIFVDTFDDLPNLVENDIGNGMVVYVADRQVHLISMNQRWLGLDGRVLKDDGGRVTIWGWGGNSSGQIGNNTVVNTSSPVATSGNRNTWRYASAGAIHNMAIDSTFALWGWGSGSNGRLGSGNTQFRSSPTQITTAGTNWASVSAGNSHTLGIKRDGTLWAWGQGSDGRLGNNATGDVLSPVQITSDTTWAAVSAGYAHSTALKTDGSLWTWGAGGFGRLGDGTVISRSSPIQVGAAGEWKDATASAFSTTAIKANGTMWSWGHNIFGQVGDGTVDGRLEPTQIAGGGTTWSKVAAGREHILAIKTDGTLWTWGYNVAGQLGNNSTTNQSSPVQVAGGGTTWSNISANRTSSGAVKTDGTLWMWGNGLLGRLGNNSTTNRSSPTLTASTSTKWSHVTCGEVHTIGVQTDTTFTP